MPSQPVNPYESPEDFAREDLGKERSRKHHLSNRVMATIAGTIGALFATVGITALLEIVLTQPKPPAGSEASFYAAVTITCVILPLLGGGLLSVAVFLWRYDAQESVEDEATQLRASS